MVAFCPDNLIILFRVKAHFPRFDTFTTRVNQSMNQPKYLYPLFLLLSLLFLTSTVTTGQKVALVLSGGGSRGAAHIGVLRALEENHIRIDYIAGTSIGAIVGSLYASGYSPDEIEKLMESQDFMRWASGDMKEDYIYYYRKEDPNASWFSLDFNPKKKLSTILPTNLISPYEMDFAFMDILAPGSAACGYNFDSLMIPFRCVVADVDSSSPVTMSKGDLSSAVRGSMSIPFVFKPITINGKLVYDGGMYNNFPANVAIDEFKPEVIIGSRVAARYNHPDPDDLLSQIQVMLMGRQSDSICHMNSVMILPNLPEVNIISFSKTDIIGDSGYVAAIRKMPRIKELIKDSISAEEIRAKREKFKRKCPEMLFDSIYITGLNSVQSKYVINTLKHGKKIVSLADIRRDYFRIINEGFIKSIYPIARYNPHTGLYDLYLDIQKADAYTIQAGGNLSIGANSGGFIELQYKYLWTHALHFMANGYFGRFYNSLKLGGRIDFPTKRAWFIEAAYTYNHFDYFANAIYFFDDKTPSYVIHRENLGELRIGVPATNKGKMVFSLVQAATNSKYYQSNFFSRTDTADQTAFTFINPEFCFELNNLNRKQYASAGSRFKMSLGYLNGMEKSTPGSMWLDRQIVNTHRQWGAFRLTWDNYFKAFGPVKLGFYGEGLISNQTLFRDYMSSIIYSPAFQPVPDMQTQFLPSFHATSYAAAGLKVVVRIVKNLEFRIETYLFQPYQEIYQNDYDITASFGKPFSDRSFLGSSTLVFHTFLGPFGISLNYYDKMSNPYSLSFNFGYTIFNRRAIN